MSSKLYLSLILLSFSFLVNAQIQNPVLKFGKGLQITAADSSMHLKMGIRFQSLFNTEGAIGNNEDWETSFLVRRARLKFEGWALTPNLKYKMQLALSNKDLKSTADFSQTSNAPKIVLDAFVKWKFHKNLSLLAGTAKLPGLRQTMTSSQKLSLVNRSLVHDLFNLDRDMSLQLHGKFNFGKSIIKPAFSWSLGEGRNITDSNIGGYNYIAQLEFLPYGDFTSKGTEYEADLKREPTPKVSLSATFNLNKGASRQKQSGKFLIDEQGNYLQHDLQTIFLDAQVKYRGISFIGEYARKRVVGPEVSEMVELDKLVDVYERSYYTGNGFNFQASYLFKNDWEIAARYATVTPNYEISFTGTDEYTLGLSKYIVNSSLKIQSDVSLISKEYSDNDILRYRLQFEFAF